MSPVRWAQVSRETGYVGEKALLRKGFEAPCSSDGVKRAESLRKRNQESAADSNVFPTLHTLGSGSA